MQTGFLHADVSQSGPRAAPLDNLRTRTSSVQDWDR